MAKPKLVVLTDRIEAPYGIEVAGTNWGAGPVKLLVDGESPPSRLRVLRGEQHGAAVQPIDGAFSAVIDARGLEPGAHEVTAVSTAHEAEAMRAADDAA